VQPLIGATDSVYLPAGVGVFAGNVIGGRTVSGKACIYRSGA
jgi:hypothetical protein